MRFLFPFAMLAFFSWGAVGEEKLLFKGDLTGPFQAQNFVQQRRINIVDALNKKVRDNLGEINELGDVGYEGGSTTGNDDVTTAHLAFTFETTKGYNCKARPAITYGRDVRGINYVTFYCTDKTGAQTYSLDTQELGYLSHSSDQEVPEFYANTPNLCHIGRFWQYGHPRETLEGFYIAKSQNGRVERIAQDSDLNYISQKLKEFRNAGQCVTRQSNCRLDGADILVGEQALYTDEKARRKLLPSEYQYVLNNLVEAKYCSPPPARSAGNRTGNRGNTRRGAQ